MEQTVDRDWTIPSEDGYNLPPPYKALLAPMPDAEVKFDWKGETKDQLLARSGMLPDFVPDLPRAYLVPPCPSSQAEIAVAPRDNGHKRKRDINDATSSSSTSMPRAVTEELSQFPLDPPPYPRPPADPQHGEVVESCWSWETKVWEHIYASGARVVCPPNSLPPLVWHNKSARPRPTCASVNGEPLYKKLRQLEIQQSSTNEVQDGAQQEMSVEMEVDPSESSTPYDFDAYESDVECVRS